MLDVSNISGKRKEEEGRDLGNGSESQEMLQNNILRCTLSFFLLRHLEKSLEEKQIVAGQW